MENGQFKQDLAQQKEQTESKKWTREAGSRLKRTTNHDKLAETNSELNRFQLERAENYPRKQFDREQTRDIRVVTESPVSYPAPKKFNKDVNVRDWIREVDLYLELTNVRDKKKTVFWAYLDMETRKMLSDVKFDEDDGVATRQIKAKLIYLFGKRQKVRLT